MILKLLLGGNMAAYEHIPSQADAREGSVGSLLSQVTIIGEREGGLIDALVPVECIDRDEVPVDRDHVEELRASIERESKRGSGTGQLSPITVGEVPEADKFLIIDGFHRDAALHERNETHIFATIRTNSSLEEVLDLRILSANTHASVTFARINEWINDAWTRSPWKDRLTVVQAFALTTNSSSGKILKLSPDEATSIRT